jgi:DNA-binding transcriptional regulator YdaS (Cro superfamily)
MNALTRYLDAKNETVSALAARMGCAPSSLTRPLSGKRNVSMDLALAVERATGGEVTAQDFLAICLDAKRGAAGEAA